MIPVLSSRDARRVNVSFPYSCRFIAWLRALPSESRSWHAADRCWSVDVEHVSRLVALGKQIFGEVDLTALDPAHRRAIAGDRGAEHVAPERCYAVLHLLPTAPEPVVKAAYRALARLNHPDRGGSSADMAAITSAYQAIVGRP